MFLFLADQIKPKQRLGISGRRGRSCETPDPPPSPRASNLTKSKRLTDFRMPRLLILNSERSSSGGKKKIHMTKLEFAHSLSREYLEKCSSKPCWSVSHASLIGAAVVNNCHVTWACSSADLCRIYFRYGPWGPDHLSFIYAALLGSCLNCAAWNYWLVHHPWSQQFYMVVHCVHKLMFLHVQYLFRFRFCMWEKLKNIRGIIIVPFFPLWLFTSYLGNTMVIFTLNTYLGKL